MSTTIPKVQWFEALTVEDVPLVGGKNASLGEMIQALKPHGIQVPDGFATTSQAYWEFLEFNHLTDKISSHLHDYQHGNATLEQVGKAIRRLFARAQFPPELTEALRQHYAALSRRYDMEHADVAVRSSATAEDLPHASFAGQQETFLNISGEAELLEACRKCYGSLFTDRAISYREAQGFDHMRVALSIGVQKMVRSDKASSGVMFTIDTETGFRNAIIINGAWGLGETVVQGAVTPDQFTVFKPLLDRPSLKPIIEKALGSKEKKMIYAVGGSETTKNVETTTHERRAFVLNDDEILQLARWAQIIESHYGRPMDIEWAKDGENGALYIVQARPETVQSRREAGSLSTYRLTEKGERLLTGVSIGEAIATGEVCVIKNVSEIDRFTDGSILVTGMTDPDWVPVMRRAAGIVTDYGGRTCHAAIVSRELGVPAIVGTGEATHVLKTGQPITLSCAEGDHGYVYDGILKFERVEQDIQNIPNTHTKIMMNLGDPAAAFRWWRLPCEGIGLARMEFIISNLIKIHPMALVHFGELQDKMARAQIEALTRAYADKTEYFVDHLARGIAKIAASRYPDPVIVRLSDFKTNEYANLIGGSEFEPEESNPMLGFRGASRYAHPLYRDGFALECRAIRRVREEIGMDNVIIMIPFCRTLEEADQVLSVMGEHGLTRGIKGLQIYVMAEIPSNILLAKEFAKRFDGFSIGSNDLTQLVLGVDRDSSLLAPLFNERNAAVELMIYNLIQDAHEVGSKVGICGQAPSDFPEFSQFLVRCGIDSISLNPDSVIRMKWVVVNQEYEHEAMGDPTV